MAIESDTLPDPQGNHAAQLIKTYLKACDFSCPATLQWLAKQNKFVPQVDVQLEHQSNGIGQQKFEVSLGIKVTVSHEKETIYQVFVKQGGLFTIPHQDRESQERILSVQCMYAIFPFVRAAIADVISRAGLSQLLLDTIDFESLYQRQLKNTQITPTSQTRH